jgi:hypothetical protein
MVGMKHDREAACERKKCSGGTEVHERIALTSRILEGQATWESNTVRSG